MKKIVTLITGLAVLVSCVSCGHEMPEEESAVVAATVAETTVPETTTMKTEVTTTSTTTTTYTTTTTTTETVLTSPTTTVAETISETTPVETESPTEVLYEPVTEVYTEPVVQSYLPISEYERILLCNLVGREYGSDYVPEYEKAKVVAVVMNRVNSPNFPNSIYEVLTQPYQFSGYLASDCYSYQVTDSVIAAVDYYFNHTSEFSTSIFYFEGDGIWNYFS